MSEALSIDARLEAMAVARDVTTIMLPAPNGGFLIYVSPRELDITRGVMSALVDIKLRRRELGGPDSTVKIERMTVASPGSEYYYKLVDEETGKTLCEGYARTEQQARKRMRDFMLANPE